MTRVSIHSPANKDNLSAALSWISKLSHDFRTAEGCSSTPIDLIEWMQKNEASINHEFIFGDVVVGLNTIEYLSAVSFQPVVYIDWSIKNEEDNTYRISHHSGDNCGISDLRELSNILIAIVKALTSENITVVFEIEDGDKYARSRQRSYFNALSRLGFKCVSTTERWDPEMNPRFAKIQGYYLVKK